MPLTPQEVEQFLKQPHIAIVATMDPDGQPHAVPTWYDYSDGQIVFHTGLRSRKYRNLRRNNRITICIDTREPPYKAVVIYGRAQTEVGTDEERTWRMALAYLGERAGTRYARSVAGSRLVIVRVQPERIISWDYGRGDNP